MIAPDRSADLRAVVAHELDRVRRGQVPGRFARDGAVSLIAARGVEVTARAAEVVRAALRDHVQLHARGHDARVGPARRDLHLFERVEVEVQGRAAGGAHVGDVHAVDVPRVVRGSGAFGDVHRLLARLAAADVDAVDLHGRGGLHDRPWVAGARNLLELDT